MLNRSTNRPQMCHLRELQQTMLASDPDLSKSVRGSLDGGIWEPKRLSGLEGALIVPPDKSEGAILINDDRHETRKRYTIAHEIGHYVHPFHRGNSDEGFYCKARDLAIEKAKPNDKHARMEQQANEFAAELLGNSRFHTPEERR